MCLFEGGYEKGDGAVDNPPKILRLHRKERTSIAYPTTLLRNAELGCNEKSRVFYGFAPTNDLSAGLSVAASYPLHPNSIHSLPSTRLPSPEG